MKLFTRKTGQQAIWATSSKMTSGAKAVYTDRIKNMGPSLIKHHGEPPQQNVSHGYSGMKAVQEPDHGHKEHIQITLGKIMS